MKCTAKICSYWATIPNVNCTGEMVEVGKVLTDVTNHETLYQCGSCKTIKLC